MHFIFYNIPYNIPAVIYSSDSFSIYVLWDSPTPCCQLITFLPPTRGCQYKFPIDTFRQMWRNVQNHNYVLNIFITHIFHFIFGVGFPNTYILENPPLKLLNLVITSFICFHIIKKIFYCFVIFFYVFKYIPV